MSALPSQINPAPRRQNLMMEVTVTGRIEEVQRYDGSFFTRLVCPAPDQYSQPSYIKVHSKNRVGSTDDIVTLHCRLGGYKRAKYQTKPNKDGEVFSVVPVDMTLELID